MKIAEEVAKAAGQALASVRAGADKLVGRRYAQGVATIKLESAWFADGGALPRRSSSESEGVPPPLSWSEPPAETRELVLIVEDPDAPKPEPFVHWLVYDINPATRSLDVEGAKHAREGKNSLLKEGFAAVAPPPGHGVHHYHFQLFALDAPLALDKGEGKSRLVSHMEGHVIGFGELVGTYERGA
jgi:Raf kinase inhibitor-like YbhB/YbcL family protein